MHVSRPAGRRAGVAAAGTKWERIPFDSKGSEKQPRLLSEAFFPKLQEKVTGKHTGRLAGRRTVGEYLFLAFFGE